jgi:hypothetical protein
MAIDLSELKKEINYKYKPQSIKFGKAIMVAYIDARDAQDLLDEVVGPENWQTDYSVINGNLFCRVGINEIGVVARRQGEIASNERWIWKTDCGTESNQEKEKGESSDAFKRACVQWGIGRFLYRLGVVELPTKKHTNGKEYPATKDGKILWSNDAISDYIRSIKGKSVNAPKAPVSAPVKPTPKKYAKAETSPKYNKVQYSDEVIKKVTSLEHEGLKGKECLNAHLAAYNTASKTEYKMISELNTDEKLLGLITFIENLVPKGI